MRQTQHRPKQQPAVADRQTTITKYLEYEHVWKWSGRRLTHGTVSNFGSSIPQTYGAVSGGKAPDDDKEPSLRIVDVLTIAQVGENGVLRNVVHV
jgi:hypothetical protein